MHNAMVVQSDEVVRLLFVEDNIDDYEIVKHMAENVGENIVMERACTGTEALKKVAGRDYDIIFLDYRLPDMDGLEFMRRTDGLDTPIIFITGRGNETVAVEAVKRGACDYIRKDDINEKTLAGLIKSNKKLMDLGRGGKITAAKKRRDSLSITISILSNAIGGMGRTQLVYRTNLNFGTMDKYLKLLMKNGLISSYVLDGGKHYRTTEEGTSFLEELKKIQEFIL